MKKILISFIICLSVVLANAQTVSNHSWTADNGNGTYTNPLFYDEFSDPDMIRVGDDFYLAGTTMHCTPGVVILHSKDLVNWEFMSYCFDKFDMGDEFSLKNGKEIYGQGIWAPCIRYHEGKFYVFSNINGHGLQVYIAENPSGPWKHINMGGNIYDLSVLFDDNGKIYAVHTYGSVKVTEVKPDFSGYVEGSERTVIPEGNAMGEGHHVYKIKGMYYIISADYSPMGRMQCARAKSIYGPYETVVIANREALGMPAVTTVNNVGLGRPVPSADFTFDLSPKDDNALLCSTLHQGGIVDLPNGDWWGFSMMDFIGVGRTTCLSPVTWTDGWPYFGLEGNLGRTPRTWTKPNVSQSENPHAPYQRSDNFNAKSLLPIWQWNHDSETSKWSLSKGKLRLRTLPANDFLWAKNTLTQRCIGPESIATVELDVSNLKEGDYAGLAVLNMPYSSIGIERKSGSSVLRWFDQCSHKTVEKPLPATKVWLRIYANLDEAKATLGYSVDGQNFTMMDETSLPYQLKTFQGARIALFAYNTHGKEGGYAEFDNFTLNEPLADRSANLPIGKEIVLVNKGNGSSVWANPHGMLHSQNGKDPKQDASCCFRVHDRGNGRVALEAMNGTGFVTVVGVGLSADVRLMKEETEGSLFMWQDMLHGDCMLLSLKTNRYVGIHPTTGEPYAADWQGTTPNRKDGTVFHWEEK